MLRSGSDRPTLCLGPKFEPCRQERRLSLLPASPLPRLHQRGDFPHTKRSVPDRPMLRTPPGHREDSLPRVGCWVNQIHGSETGAYPRTMVATSSNRKTGRWERPAVSISSAWESSRSHGCVWEGLQRTAWEPLADIGCTLHSTRNVTGKMQWRISPCLFSPNF